MSITVTPTVTPAAISLKKFRELSADSIVYLNDDHNVELPRHITLTSELPVPRKGNMGTLKTTVNARYSVELNAGTDEAKVVPVICKIQTSFPVGTTLADRKAAVARACALALQDDPEFDALFGTGILPND